MKQMKQMMLIGACTLIMALPVSVFAGKCTNGVTVYGNSTGTYCNSRIAMNWWSAHAWCNAQGMKMITLEDCDCPDESKCDMSKMCPNLNGVANLIFPWTATPYKNNSAYFIYSGDHIQTRNRDQTNLYVLCK